MHSRDGGQLAALPMNDEQTLQVDIAHPIPVGHHECFIADPFGQTFQPASRLRVDASIDEVNHPILAIPLINVHIAVQQIDRQILAGGMKVQEITLDHV